ncbi:transcriptional regulator [Nitrosopumilus sp.]|uniref:transcriptional regulator n=1 Tax=Nitrosopumilus sp. TaxID=2024843 RepID=UPI0026298562|nr:transcriptional regulator [Nitrosopumilus sp.]
MKQLTPSQIRKYDVDHKIFCALSNLESRIILFCIIKNSNSAAEISHITKIPLSTVYKKIQEMEDLALVYAHHAVSSETNSKHTKFYKSRIKSADISFQNGKLKLTLLKN